MSIRFKFLMPLLCAVLILGALMMYVLWVDMGKLEQNFARSTVRAKQSEVLASIGSISTSAREMASLFSRMPAVVEAYSVAHQGDMNDEIDARSQEAREMLRESMGPILKGYEDASGGKKFRLHFHLPNARSLVRLWREKQAKRDGKWMDVSDDLSSFRQTVIDVNASGRPVQGIELGRGGFVVRGLAPVKLGDKGLGSVEVLLDFAPILAAASAGDDEKLLLFMNADKLSVAKRLQDAEKYPIIDGKYVLVSGDKKIASELDSTFMEEGHKDLAFSYLSGKVRAAFPVLDYRDAQIGVMVYERDTSATSELMSGIGIQLGGFLLAILVVILLLVWFFLTRTVLGPVRRVKEKIRDIAEDRADLSDRLDQSARDEMGDLSLWFNALMDKLGDILRETAMYKYMMDAVPDPIFAVDEQMNFLAGNKATQTVAGRKMRELLGSRCAKVFNTSVCDTADCPIKQCHKSHESVQGEPIFTELGGKEVVIQPIAEELRGPDGEVFGYMEVARDVTDLVYKERDLSNQLERIAGVNERIGEASRAINESADELMGGMDEVSEGADRQRARAAETATAMEEMNATVLEVASNAGAAAEQADEMRAKAQEGAEVVGQAVEAIAEVSRRSEELKVDMGTLGQRAEGIGQVLTVITDIADQTNLLALNAAIEAARAGDAGRGFAVVADEVRKLAEKTMLATKEVEDAIGAIQSGAKNNVAAVEASADAVERATELVNSSGEVLDAIRTLVLQSADQVRAIATAVEEQSATSEEINRSIEEVNVVAEQTASGTGHARDSIRRLQELAMNLERLADGKD